MDGHQTIKVGQAAARHRIHKGWQVRAGRVAMTTRSSDRCCDTAGGGQPALRAPIRIVHPGTPAGKILYVANENDNTVTIIDLEKRVASADIQVGVEPEAWLSARTARF